MLKKTNWKHGVVLSLKLREDLFTLAQMREGYCLQCFNISNQNGIWESIDLNQVPTLFTIVASEKALKTLALAELKTESVTPDQSPTPKIMLKAVIGNNGDHGACLIELTDEFESYEATVLKPALTLKNDLETLYKYEMSGMVGNPEKLRARLIRYFDTGVNWGDSKVFFLKTWFRHLLRSKKPKPDWRQTQSVQAGTFCMCAIKMRNFPLEKLMLPTHLKHELNNSA